ncbi:MAG: elongation factor P maturation arginine rhamnosyltransferase EarP, partial [Burkholderiaceae bacterium]|nr:elongation factor P maturation arginine rhamnosyltransferase EarP [Burkholderiaceae bacterium]
GLPFVWQPYRQADDAHLKKLDAWLAQAAQPLPGWSQLHRYFSPAGSHPESERDLTEILRALLTNWQAVQDACKSLGQAQFQRPSFEESLLRHWHLNRQQSR